MALLAGVGVVLAIGVGIWLHRTERFWRNPIADARFQTVTDFDGLEQAAAISRDGHFVAFLSDRDGPMDVWVTQAGSGEFHNLTRGSVPELVNPSDSDAGVPAGWIAGYALGSAAGGGWRTAAILTYGECLRWVGRRGPVS